MILVSGVRLFVRCVSVRKMDLCKKQSGNDVDVRKEREGEQYIGTAADLIQHLSPTVTVFKVLPAATPCEGC